MKRLFFSLAICLSVIFLIPVLAKAGVTDVLPQNMELVAGESERMFFQIQSIANPKNLTCIYQVMHKSCVEIEFDEKETIVFVYTNSTGITSGGRKDVWGTVKAPTNITQCPIGNYTEEFFVSCGLYNPSSGYAVRTDVAGMKINIKIVESHNPKYKPMYPVQPALPDYTIYYIILGSAIAISVVAYIVYRLKKRPTPDVPTITNTI